MEKYSPSFLLSLGLTDSQSTMQFDLNQFNISRSLTVPSIITMVLHLGYSTVEQSLVGTIYFLATVDAQMVNAGITVDAMEVESMFRQVVPISVESPHLMATQLSMVVEYMHRKIVM